MLLLKRRLLGRLNSFSPDKIQRRVLKSALIWTARWTISLIIIAVLPSVLLVLGLVSSEKFWKINIIALLFVFDKYCSIVD
jgi:hypothetical protein